MKFFTNIRALTRQQYKELALLCSAFALLLVAAGFIATSGTPNIYRLAGGTIAPESQTALCCGGFCSACWFPLYITSFTANPTSPYVGGATTLSWTSYFTQGNVDGCSLQNISCQPAYCDTYDVCTWQVCDGYGNCYCEASYPVTNPNSCHPAVNCNTTPTYASYGGGSGSQVVSNVTNQTTYRLNCYNTGDTYGGASADLTLNPVQQPGCTMTPPTQTVTLPTTPSISYTTNAYTTGITYSVDGVNMGAPPGNPFTPGGAAVTPGTHTVIMTASNAGGSNTCGTTGNVVVNAAIVAPTATIAPTNPSVTAGNSQAFTYTLGGSAPTALNYFVDGINRGSASGGAFTVSSTYLTVAGSPHSVYLQVSNTAGTNNSNTASVVVNPADICTDIAGSQVALPGGCTGPTPSPAGLCIPSGYTYNGTACVSSTPTITSFVASPSRVRQGNTTTLTYAITNPPASCTVTGTNGFNYTLSPALASGSIPTNAITASTRFTLTCSGVSVSATVGIVPQFQEQ